MKFIKRMQKIILPHNFIGYTVSYLIAILFGSYMLSLPISLQDGQDIAWIDALFTAASAVSVTGLSTIVVSDVFSRFGLIVLLLIIQIGGIGLMFLIVSFWLLTRRKIGFSQRHMIMMDQNQFTRSGMVRLIRNVIIVLFWIELIGFLVISHYLYFNNYFVYKEALFQGLFMTISLTANAGFDIAPNNDSFQMFAQDYFLQTMAILLMFLGSIGFWVLSEVKEYVIAKKQKRKFKFSFFVRMIVPLHIFFIILGAVFILVFEFNGFLQGKSVIESLYYALFMSVTTRNAGFSTMNVNNFTEATSMILMIWMFIGANPNSYGGGIRTTSIVLVFLSIKAFATGKHDVIFKKRRIKFDTIMKAYIALVSALFIVLTGVIILTFYEPVSLHAIMFEVTSAYGTTGLSKGITSSLHTVSKVTLIFIMFIGRLGILALVMIIRPINERQEIVKYPEEDVIVG